METARRPNIEDVAQRAGVSRAAVSKVIRDAYGVSDEMRAKVEAAISDLGYRPRVSARGMRGSTYTLGVALPSIANPFFTKLITGAAQELEGTRYQLIIAPAGLPYDGGPHAIEILADRQVDGILAVSPNAVPEWLEEVGRHTPLLMLGRHDDSSNYDTIVNDDVMGARIAVQHLYELGHRDIAHLTIPLKSDAHLRLIPHHVRAGGYEKAMAELGLADRTRLVASASNQEEGRLRALELLTGDRPPTAIFAGHDELGLGVLQAVSELGLTPGQVSVIGYDDTDIAAHPLVSLTSINQSGTYMGGLFVRLILERIAGRTEPAHEVIQPKVMARRTTAPLEPRPGAARTGLLSRGLLRWPGGSSASARQMSTGRATAE